MKNLVSLLLLIMLIVGFSGFAETKNLVVDFGEFTYSVPASWNNQIPEGGGYNYHYETGSPLSGIYIMSSVDALESSPATADYLLDVFISAITSPDICESSAPLDYIDCAQLSEYPFRACSAVYDVDGLASEITYYVWTDYKNVYTIGLSNMAKPETVEQSLESILATVRSKNAIAEKNSRRNPAAVGQPVEIKASRNGLEYTMEVVVNEFFRGEEYEKLTAGKRPKTPDSGCEYVAVNVTVTFKSIDSIDKYVLNTDDPEIQVDSIWTFETYTADGSKYDNVHYSVSGLKDLSNVYEGASTTGYFQFEISMDDPAPMLVYEPEYNQKAWISLC